MIPVILESPYAGDVERNIRYARACMRDCLLRGEAPFASHLLYTQEGVLKDDVFDERKLGIESGFTWRARAVKTVVYMDFGWTAGMLQGENHAATSGQVVERRTLPRDSEFWTWLESRHQ